MAGSTFDFGECFCTALAHGRVARVLADVGGIVPAALALFAIGFVDSHGHTRGHPTVDGYGRSLQHLHLRHDKKRA